MENKPSSSSKTRVRKICQIDSETQKDSTDTIYLYNNLFKSGYISDIYVSVNNERYLTRTQRILKRVYYRLTYLKLRRCIKTICSNLTIYVLRAISPKLYDFFKDRVLKTQFRLRLLGESWPPLIIYQTTSRKLKTISIETSCDFYRSGCKTNSSWSFLFSDEPLVIVKRPKQRNRMNETTILSRDFRLTRIPQSKCSYKYPKHRELLKYNWKSQDQRKEERRSDLRFRSPTSLTGYTKGGNFHSLTNRVPKLMKKVAAVDMVRIEYRDYWNNLGCGEIIYTRTTPT